MALRVGLVGTGTWAVRVHGAGAAASEGVELVGVWGRDISRTAAAAGVLGTAALSSFQDLLTQVDVVDFAVPPDVQVPLALEAARAGKHLLLEKPLGLHAAQARQIAGAVDAAGVASVVLLTRLWAPRSAEWLDELVAAGGWTTGHVQLHAALSEEALTPWRQQHGPLWDVGPHALSLLERVLGPVTGLTGQESGGVVELSAQHAGGAASTASLSLQSPSACTAASFAGPGTRSRDMPALRVDDAVHAHGRALDHLAVQVRTRTRSGTADADYAARLTELLANARLDPRVADTRVRA